MATIGLDVRDSDEGPVYHRSGHHYREVNERRQTDEYKKYRERYEQWPRMRRLSDFPVHLDLELSSACNLRCPMCPTVYIDDPSFEKFKEGNMAAMMPMDMFKKAIDEGSQYGDFCSIKLNYRGESTLHPQIVEMISYASDAGVIDIMVNTNGNYPISLNKEMVDAGLTWVAFSLDAIRPETYGICRKGGNFFDAYAAALDMCKHVDRLHVQVGYVVQRMNKDETDEFVEFWARMPVHRILVSDAYNSGGLIKNEKAILTKKYVSANDSFCCPQLWQRVVVWNDGRMFPCCHAWNAPDDLYLGNISDMTIRDAWHSVKLQNLRATHAAGGYENIGTCAMCPYPKEPADIESNE